MLLRKMCGGLTFVLILMVPLSGCAMSKEGSRSQSDSSPLMDLWSTYSHCYGSADIDAIREDAQHLSQAANTFDSAAESSSPERDEPVPSRPTNRLSVDPAAMAVSCTLRAGQAAQAMGRLNVARDMFQMVVLCFPPSRYQYYRDHALQGLEQLDAASHPKKLEEKPGLHNAQRLNECRLILLLGLHSLVAQLTYCGQSLSQTLAQP